MNYIYNNSNLILAQSQQKIKKIIEKRTSTKCIFFPSWPEEDVKKRVIKNKYFLKKKTKNLYIYYFY